MNIGSLVKVRSLDARLFDADAVLEREFGVDRAGEELRFVVLHGEAGVGKSALAQWLAARLADRALTTTVDASVPVLVDLERFDAAWLAASPTNTQQDDSLLKRIGERQLGAWVGTVGASERPATWLLDHVEVLSADALRPVLASAMRSRSTIVLVCSEVFWQREMRRLLDERAIYGASVEVAAYEVVGLGSLDAQRRAIETILGSEDRALARPIADVAHASWDLAHRPTALGVACAFARSRGVDELAHELRSPGAGAALLDEFLQALWARRRQEPPTLPDAYRRVVKEVARAAIASRDDRAQGACGEVAAEGMLTYCDVEEAAERVGLPAAATVRTLETCGMVRYERTSAGDRYELPSPSFAMRYAEAEPVLHPALPAPSRSWLAYPGQLLAWLLFLPEAWRQHLRSLGGFAPTATIHDLLARRSPAGRRLLATMLAMPVVSGLLVAAVLAVLGASGRDVVLGAATAVAVGAGGGLVLAAAAGMGFGVAYVFFGGLLGGLATGAVASGGLRWLAGALQGSAQAGVTESQIVVAFLSGLAISFVAGLKGLGQRKPPVGSVRARLVSLQSVLVTGAVLVPIAAFVVFALQQEQVQPAHERDVLIGSVALFFFAAAVHWRTQRVVPTLASVGLLTVAYGAFTLPIAPPWTLVGTAFQSAVIWASFFSVGYVVLRDFLFPIGERTRFAVDEGSVAAMIVAFAVSLAGLSLVVAGATASPATTVAIGLGLIGLGLGQRWWRSYLGAFAFAPWDWPVAVRTGRIERHSATWDSYHAPGRVGLTRALRTAIAQRPEVGRRFLAYFARTAQPSVTLRAWEDVALAKASSCRSVEDIAELPEPGIVEAMEHEAADPGVRAIVSEAGSVRRARIERDQARMETVLPSLERLAGLAHGRRRDEVSDVASTWLLLLRRYLSSERH